jgi:hypothetical protein
MEVRPFHRNQIPPQRYRPCRRHFRIRREIHTFAGLHLDEPSRVSLARAHEIALRYCETPSLLARDLESMIQAEIDLQTYAWLSHRHEEGKRGLL